MEEIDTPDDLDFTQQEHLEEKSEKIWFSSGLSCLNSEGIVFHPEVEEAEAGRMEGERNYFIKLLEETKKEAVQCGSVRGIYGGEDGVMHDDSTISHDSDSNTLEQKGGGGGGSVTDLALQLKMLPKEEQVKAKLSLMANQLESLSPGDLKREEFVRFDREGVVRKVEDMIDSVQRQPKDYYAVMYERAGEVVDEEEGKISLTKYEHLLKDEIAYTIQVVLDENPLNFVLQDFVKVSSPCPWFSS